MVLIKQQNLNFWDCEAKSHWCQPFVVFYMLQPVLDGKWCTTKLDFQLPNARQGKLPKLPEEMSCDKQANILLKIDFGVTLQHNPSHWLQTFPNPFSCWRSCFPCALMCWRSSPMVSGYFGSWRQGWQRKRSCTLVLAWWIYLRTHLVAPSSLLALWRGAVGKPLGGSWNLCWSPIFTIPKY